MFRPFLLAIGAILMAFATSRAQTDPLRTKLDDVFSAIDKADVPTGFLEEFGAPFIPLDVFDGILSDSNKLNMEAWRMAYATLYSSHISGINPLPGIQTVSANIQAEEAAGTTVPIPIFYGTYNYIRPDALTANLLTLSSEIYYDVPGRPAIPYDTRQLFIASPSRNYTRNGSISLVFKSNLYYSNSGKSISSFQVDFDNGGGYITAGWNSPINVTYSSNGIKRLKIRINFTDASVAECYSILEVEGAAIGTLRYEQPYDLQQSFQDFSTYGGGSAFVRYSRLGTERAMTKPLIVVEGFDISTIAGSLQGNYDFTELLDNLSFPEPTFEFNERLDMTAGYDLVFVDFGDGTQDIKKNALLLRAVINWVNAQKVAAGSTEQNVVLGISMGGLVGRYCLADMTKSGLNPQTRLLITHDSPHRGANVPLGIQLIVPALAKLPVGIPGLTIRDVNKNVDAAMNVLEAPATTQMLITKANFSYNAFGNPSYTFSANTFLESEYRPMVTYAPTDIQPAYQVVATSLGSECGTEVAGPGAPLVGFAGTFNKELVPWILRRGAIIEASANASPAAGTSAQIVSFRQTWTYRILGININIIRQQFAANNPITDLRWDGAPGGVQGAGTFGGGLPQANFNFIDYLWFSINSNLGNAFSFVPTVSALDIESINAVSLFAPYNGGFSPGNPARVANFIATRQAFTTNNEPHPRFTARTAQWMYNVMEGIPNGTVSCNANCLPNQGAIEGDFATNACVGATASFQVRGFPAGSTYNWTTAGGISIAGQWQSAITATRTGSTATSLTVEVTTPCGVFTFNRNIPAIHVGDLTGTVIYYDKATGTPQYIPAAYINGVCPLDEVLLMLDPQATITNVTQSNSNFPNTWWWDSGGIHFFSDFLTTYQWPSFEVTFSYGCASASQTFHFWEDNCMSPFVVSPNPASGQITIKAATVDKSAKTSPPAASVRIAQAPKAVTPKASPAQIHQLILLDMSGREMIRKILPPASSYSLDISGVPAGMYLIRIFDGETWSVQKVIIR